MTRLREVTESLGQVVLDGVGRVSARVQERRPLASDLLESDDAYLVVFDAPGAEMADIDVRYEDGVVRVRVERFREFQEGYEMLFPGRGLTLEGQADLPDDAVVDPRAASATLAANGTLRVEVPKVDEGDGPITVGEEEEENGDADEETPDAADEETESVDDEAADDDDADEE
ncbi:Hsp20/alpha crystallin family protein [Halorarius halobius]|uniref:Hsp20 family protein n=1 Tax=Halorarius halobius TaxID=2962671 RepID=UPI0020CEF58B|nr:Hsp20/alpha crystallin family protein [Halorarius halobius]